MDDIGSAAEYTTEPSVQNVVLKISVKHTHRYSGGSENTSGPAGGKNCNPLFNNALSFIQPINTAGITPAAIAAAFAGPGPGFIRAIIHNVAIADMTPLTPPATVRTPISVPIFRGSNAPSAVFIAWLLSALPSGVFINAFGSFFVNIFPLHIPPKNPAITLPAPPKCAVVAGTEDAHSPGTIAPFAANGSVNAIIDGWLQANCTSVGNLSFSSFCSVVI